LYLQPAGSDPGSLPTARFFWLKSDELAPLHGGDLQGSGKKTGEKSRWHTQSMSLVTQVSRNWGAASASALEPGEEMIALRLAGHSIKR
jgi:hypothetical protein